VRWCSEAPARLFGLYPKKGTISVHADADIIVVDTTRCPVIDDASQISRAARTPFAGLRAGGTIRLVMQRGKTIMRDGQFLGKPRRRYIPGGPIIH
jgi:dihydroorotase-like cyclic amidohydrolase